MVQYVNLFTKFDGFSDDPVSQGTTYARVKNKEKTAGLDGWVPSVYNTATVCVFTHLTTVNILQRRTEKL